MCMDRNVLVVISPSHGILVFRDTLLECPPTDLAPFYSGIMWPYVVIAYTQGEQSGKGLGYVTPCMEYVSTSVAINRGAISRSGCSFIALSKFADVAGRAFGHTSVEKQRYGKSQ